MSHNSLPTMDKFTPEELFAVRLTSMTDNFCWNIDALLEVAEVSIPEIVKLDSTKQISSTVGKVMSSLSKASVDKIVNGFRKYRSAQKEGSGDKPPSLVEIMWEEVKSETWGPTFMTHLHEAFQRPPRLPIFLQSATVSAVSNFEVLLSGLVAQYYFVTPQALEATSREKEKEFSLKELKAMDSVADAIDIAIERRVDELMFGSFGEWKKFFADRMNLKFEDYCIDWEFLKEVFQRRHVIVHNGGVASRRYLRNVAPRYASNVSEGDHLQVDENYVTRASNEILTFGVLLSTAVGIKLAKEEKSRFISHLHKINYRCLIKGRHELVEKCSAYGESIALDMGDKLTFRVNRWIAGERMSKDSVRSEVEKWDVMALSPRYKLAKHCLLDEKNSAMMLLKSMYSTGDISFEDIIEWPLLETLRGTDEYVSMTRRMEIPEGWKFSDVILYENPKSGTLHLRKCSLLRADFTRRSVDQVDLSTAVLCQRCKPSLT